MRGRKRFLPLMMLLLALLWSAPATSLEFDLDSDDYTDYDPDKPEQDAGSDVPVNGTFYLEVNVTEVDSGEDSVELLDSGINESEYDEKIIGNGGTSHSVRGLGPNGTTFYESGFKLYSTSVAMTVGPNGTRSAEHDVDRYPKHLFRIPADYRIEELVIKEGNQTIFSLNIPQRVCIGENPPHYCRWNNYTETSEEGGVIGVFEPSDSGNENRTEEKNDGGENKTKRLDSEPENKVIETLILLFDDFMPI